MQYKVQQFLFYCSLVSLAYIDWQTLVLSAILGSFLTAVVVSAYYHRCLTHNSWKCNTFIESVLLLLGAGHGLMSGIGWSATHLKHHRYHDTPSDPHGPHRGILVNLNLALNPVEKRYVQRRLLQLPLVVMQAKYYWIIMALYFMMWCVFLNPLLWLAVNGWVVIALIVVNVLGHLRRAPTNVPFLAPLFGGELYHKNHHDCPSAHKFGSMDPGWWFIKAVCGIGGGKLNPPRSPTT